MNKKQHIILFNYGGGMRGLIPAHIMSRIEDATGLRMADMVDTFTGPSTGAILNAAMTIPHPDQPDRPRYRARHMVKFYEREGLNIFPPDRFRDFRALIHDFNNRTMKISQLRALFRHGHYNPAHLGRALRDLYGEARLEDTIRNLVIPIYNLDGDALKPVEEGGESDDAPVHTKNNFVDQGGYAVWLKNMRSGVNCKPAPSVRLRDAILASCAAPTYYPCHHFEVGYPGWNNRRHYSGIDGSIFDNPCISYHGAVRHHIPDDAEPVMIMLGTGHTLRSFKKEEWNNFGGLGVVDPVNDLPLISILFHAPETALIESFSQELGERAYVFNKSIIDANKSAHCPSPQIDDASNDNLKRMKFFAEEIIEDNAQRFDNLCALLVRNYDRKQKSASRKSGEKFWVRWLKKA